MRLFFLIVHLLCFAVGSAYASEPVRIDLIGGRYNPGAKVAYYGMKISLDTGWHTYWKSPGEGGLPPELKVTRAVNASGMRMLWPAPTIVRSLGKDVAGYESEVIFPLMVLVSDPAKPVDISISATVYGCSNICVPFRQEISSRVEPGASVGANVAKVDSWMAKVPTRYGPDNGLNVSLSRKTGTLDIDPALLGASDQSQLFFDGGLTYAAKPVYGTASGPMQFEIVNTEGKGFDGLGTGNIVVVDQGTPKEYKVNIVPETELSLAILATALLGGLILNLMPCVLPVLSLKMMAFTKDGDDVRGSFLWSAIGIWASFLFVAVLVLGLKLAGVTVGWGVQFQSPFFLAVMSVVTIVFAVSMVDAFVIYLPTGLVGAAAKLASGKGKSGSFFQGFVATLLATPCSAPFVGTAIGFAFVAPPLQLLLIFVAMGLGMAIPYFAIAIAPGLRVVMPRPGRWMTTFKVLMAMSMAAMSGYLVSLVMSTGSRDAGILLLVFVIVVTGFFVRNLPVFVLLAASIYAYPIYDEVSNAYRKEIAIWKPFEPSTISGLVKEGKIVVVDVTAKWCITCKVNEETTWNRDDVIAAISKDEVVAMRADWTRPDPMIAAYLKTFNRYGLPFNVVYTKSMPQGRVLPELLSKRDVLDALLEGSK